MNYVPPRIIKECAIVDVCKDYYDFCRRFDLQCCDEMENEYKRMINQRDELKNKIGVDEYKRIIGESNA